MRNDWIPKSLALTLQVRNLVEGRWSTPNGDRTLEKYAPRDGRLLCRFAAGLPEQADEAVSSARRAFEDGRWSMLPVQRRKDVLHKLASLVEGHLEELALLECLDVGKPIRDALSIDVPMAAATLRYYAEAADKLHGKVYAADPLNLSYQLRGPVGVVAGIVGWNFPLVLAAAKIAPALAAGNCLVLKPSELTSFSAARLAELALEAELPPGVLNVIHGDAEIGAALAAHPDVNLVTFTGSTRTGKQLLIASGHSNMKRTILECGGKAPNIVFEDCPSLEAVAEAIVAHAFWNQGQVCTASSRLLVQASIKSDLLRIVRDKVTTLKPGDPLDPESRFGAVVSRGHMRKVLDYVDTGMRQGAHIVYRSGSPPPFVDGFYVSPVIFDDVSPTHTIAQEEIFGPVLSVLSFQDEEEAIRLANSTIYGLSAILWTKNIRRAHRLSQQVKAGWVVVNATDKPLGGPGPCVLSIGGHKQSGIGVEGGLDGLEVYMNQTAVQIFM